MLDVSFSEGHAEVNLRVRTGEVIPASDLVAKFFADFEPVWQQVIEHVVAAVATDPPTVDAPAKTSPESNAAVDGGPGVKDKNHHRYHR